MNVFQVLLGSQELRNITIVPHQRNAGKHMCEQTCAAD